MKRIAIAAVLALLFGGAAWAKRAPAPVLGPSLGQTLAQIEVNARTIQSGGLPLDALEQQAIEIRREVARLPSLTVGRPVVVRTFEVRMDDAAAHLLDRAAARDRDGAADAAGDLLDELSELRVTLGYPRTH